MEASSVNQLPEGWEVLSRQEGGLRIYVNPEKQWRDEGGYRVLRIGHPNDLPTRCVLLLGETGAGKTTIVNAALNCLFGVKFEDPFRLQVREETGGRRATESQTDAVTVYVIHHQPGMEHGYNCVLIDTPGLADTRGTERQKAVKSGLEAFVTTEGSCVDELHCVGIVAKANMNRDLNFHKQMIGEMISLFGKKVPDVTCVLATFATDKPSVDAVMRNAGIRFKRMFPFDNGVLYAPSVNDDTSDHAELFPGRWKIMRKQHDAFLGYLATAPSVSTAVLRERKLFDMNKKNLGTQIKEAATLMAAYYRDKDVYSKYELQEARNRDYLEQVKKMLISLEDPSEGLCAHNCRKCRHTCHQCSDSVSEMVVLAALCDAEVVAARVTHGLTLAEPATVTTSVAVLVFTAPGDAVTASEATTGTGGSQTYSVGGALTGGSKTYSVRGGFTGGSETYSMKGPFTGGSETYSMRGPFTGGSETYSMKGPFTGGSETTSLGNVFGATASALTIIREISNITDSLTVAGTGGAAASGAVTHGDAADLKAAAGTIRAVEGASKTKAAAPAVAADSETAAGGGGLTAGGIALGAVGALSAVGAGYLVYKMLQEDRHPCDMDAVSGCTRSDCRHSLSAHVRQDKVIKKETKYEKRTNKEKKQRYDEAVAGKREANEKITRGKQGILGKMTAISQTSVDLLYHAKRTQELTSKKRDYVTEVMNHITSGSLQAGQDVTPHAGKLAAVVRQAVQKLASCTAQQARDSKTLVIVEEMFLSMFRDQ